MLDEANKAVTDQQEKVDEAQAAYDAWLEQDQEDDSTKKNSELTEDEQHASTEY